MLYTPERFGLTRLGDLLDAMAGYNEAQNERTRSLVEIVRRATTLLWNTQVVESDRRIAPELWPLPWDKETGRFLTLNDEEVKRVTEEQKKFLNEHFN